MSATARKGCLVQQLSQPGGLAKKIVQGMVLNMLLPLARPPIEWAGSGLVISQKDEIRTTSGVPSDPSYLCWQGTALGKPELKTVVLKRGYLCLVVRIVRAFALSPTSNQMWKQNVFTVQLALSCVS